MQRKLQVFLCYASEDKLIVQELYERLKSEDWIDPWLDSEKIFAGQNWNLEIEKAVHSADVIIICLSRTSTSKEGYVQKEIKHALEISEEKPEGIIHLIPLKLDNCETPRSLTKFQSVNYKSYEILLKALTERMKQIESAFRRKSDFEFICDFCGEVIDINNIGGRIYIERKALFEAKRISQEHPEAVAQRASDILSSIAYWRTAHYTCGQNEYPQYQIDISRIKTSKQVIEWTSHLMEKTWIVYTNWYHFISLLAEQIKD